MEIPVVASLALALTFAALAVVAGGLAAFGIRVGSRRPPED